MKYDCFFSYQHDDLKLVESIVDELESIGLKCWYAPRNVSGRYAKAIADGISSSKVFVLVLNHRSATSSAVLNEVELAHNVSKNGPNAIIQPLCVENIDMNAPEHQEIMYYIRRMHFINAFDDQTPVAMAHKIIKSQEHLISSKKKRSKSAYIVQDVEDKRLLLQNELLKKFDGEIYEKVIAQYDAPNVLDVGCGQGDMLISKLDGRKLSSFVGIDKSSRQIEIAKLKHEKENYYFMESDVEAASFEDDLSRELCLRGIDKFEIINISMLLLHLNDPTRLLTVLHSFLSDNGTVIIRDIDDGINFAFPDSEKAFDRIYRMCSRDDQSGNRTNGRQIYSSLFNAGYSRICLERQGFSTVGMTVEEKETLFNMYFPFTLHNAKDMISKRPWDSDYAKDHSWFKQKFDSIRAAFLEDGFVFSLGFMTYTAKK